MKTIEELIDDVGEDITTRTLNLFETEAAIEWFYTPNKALGGITPVESYKKDPETVEQILGRIEHGVYS